MADWTTRDKYGQMYTPEIDPAFDEDFRTKQIMADMESQEKKEDSYINAMNKMYLTGKVGESNNAEDLYKIANVVDNVTNNPLTRLVRNNYSKDGWLDQINDDATRAQINGAVAEVLGSMFGYNQMKKLEQGQKPTAADFAMDVLGNTPLFPLVEAHDMYDDYLDEKSASNEEEAKNNLKTGAIIGGSLIAGIPIVGKVAKGIKNGIRKGADIISDRAINNIGKYNLK